MQSPPDTEREPVTETLHGESITDPYRWLEGDGDRVAGWEQRQNEHTDTVVETETREALGPTVRELGYRESFAVPTVRGGRYFQRIEAATAEQPRLTVREDPEGEPRTLVELDEETTSLQWFEPTWDGSLLVYGLTEAGTEQYDLRVIAVDSGEIVDRVDNVGRCNGAAWEPDGGGFYYTATGAAGEGGQLEKELRYHELGGHDRLLTDEFEPERWPAVQVDPESGTVVVTVGELGTDADLFALVDGELSPVVTDVDAPLAALAHGGRVYLTTPYEAPRGRVLAADAADLATVDGIEGFETIVPESEAVVHATAPAGEGIALHQTREASSVVSVHGPDGDLRHELSLPDLSGISRGGLAGSHDSPELFFELGAFDRPTSVVHADAAAGPDAWRRVQSPELPAELDPREETGLDLTVERLWVDSTDGARLPVTVAHRADLDPDGSAPTVLYGYGGFRIPLLPSLDPFRLPFLADGGVFAVASLRGGSEFGERWHEAGARERKHHTFEDFEAAAETLIEAGYTNSDRLAGWGGSNGGLTVGTALTRRPELFGAIVASVPLADMLRFHRFLLGGAWTGEYGSPEDEQAFGWLRSYSPYHNVSERSYPATLLATAAGDTRVHPAHARKMAARLQHATTGDAPICYRSVTDTGHGVGTPTSVQIDQALDKWTFVYETLGVDSE